MDWHPPGHMLEAWRFPMAASKLIGIGIILEPNWLPFLKVDPPKHSGLNFTRLGHLASRIWVIQSSCIPKKVWNKPHFIIGDISWFGYLGPPLFWINHILPVWRFKAKIKKNSNQRYPGFCTGRSSTLANLQPQHPAKLSIKTVVSNHWRNPIVFFPKASSVIPKMVSNVQLICNYFPTTTGPTPQLNHSNGEFWAIYSHHLGFSCYSAFLFHRDPIVLFSTSLAQNGWSLQLSTGAMSCAVSARMQSCADRKSVV